jgi:endonuclease/exonuclease/phosphatase family metal-dependent hydrolase
MKSIVKTLWLTANIALAGMYVLASLSTFIPPASFSFISIGTLAFPYLLVGFILAIIINFFAERKLAIVLLCLLPAGTINFLNTIALRTEIPWQANKDSSTLRVMTWNVQGFTSYLRKKKSKSAYKTSRDEMLATMRSYNPDILCFQEYTNIENSKRRISIRKQLDTLGYPYSYCSKDRAGSFPKNPTVYVEDGVAIFSKYPITDTGRITINHDEKSENLIYADIVFNNKPVRIFTAHLQSFTIYADTAGDAKKGENIYEITYKRRKDAQYKVMETEVKHQQEVTTIRNEMNKSPYPIIYCGDLNITPTSYNYVLLKGNNLQDAFLQKGAGIGNTFYKIGPTLRIDVCLADTALQVQQCQRNKIKLSDHYPVIADVAWKK